MDLLRRIEHASFPLTLEDEADIQSAAVLVAAKLIEADLPPAADINRLPGVVLRITLLGFAELERTRDQA
jgi:hypothetical protein